MHHNVSLRVGLLGAALMAVLWTVVPAGPARGDVLICEIMYNPASDESSPNDVEWVEIVNTGMAEVNLAGWRLADEDAATGPLAEGVALAPGAVLVLIPDTLTEADFQEAWGAEVRVARLSNWGRPNQFNLANRPDAVNELLTLQRADGSEADAVNYEAAEPWPPARPDGPSIYLLPGHFSVAANDAGSAWARSTVGRHDARANRRTAIFDGEDIGSPGAVVIETVVEPQPPQEQPDEASSVQMPLPPVWGLPAVP